MLTGLMYLLIGGAVVSEGIKSLDDKKICELKYKECTENRSEFKDRCDRVFENCMKNKPDRI